MFQRGGVFILFVFLAIPSSTFCQKTENRIALAGRTFDFDAEDDTSKTEDDLKLFLVFQKEGHALFRVKRGGMIRKDSPLTWRFVGDLLYVYPAPVRMEVDGVVQKFERTPTIYAVERSPKGYLLKEGRDKSVLVEVKD